MAKKSTKESGGSLLSRLKGASKSEFAVVMGDEDDYQPRDFIDSGNYLFNAMLSGDPYKGYPSGKIVTLAGVSSSGKTFLALEAIKNAQKLGYSAILYDTEFANNDKKVLIDRGVDVDKLLYVPIDTVENLKTSVINVLDEISDEDKVVIVIDSLGNLSTSKEMEVSASGVEKRDMTRAQQLKAFFRTCTLKVGLKHVVMICINHVYACCVGDTMVLMEDGNFRRLDEIEIGDTVETQFGPKEVTNRFEFDVNRTIEVELNDGSNIEMSPEHKLQVFSEEGLVWKCAIDLNETDMIVSM